MEEVSSTQLFRLEPVLVDFAQKLSVERRHSGSVEDGVLSAIRTQRTYGKAGIGRNVGRLEDGQAVEASAHSARLENRRSQMVGCCANLQSWIAHLESPLFVGHVGGVAKEIDSNRVSCVLRDGRQE